MDIRIVITRLIPVFVLLLLCINLFVSPKSAHAANAGLIRDAEIENNIRAYATPVFLAAGLEPEAVNIYIVNDGTLNAFVAGGQNLFLNTGLIMRSNNASQIIGVIAHETGHISGGHLSRLNDALSTSSIPTILSYILGGAATFATGRGDVGAAIIAGGAGVSQRTFLSHTRGQEASADEAAMKFLDQTKQSARGFMEFMEILKDQELLSTARQDPYVRSHPLSSNRIITIRNHVANSPFSNNKTSSQFREMHARMKAKLLAFISPPGRTLRTYKKNDPSLAARYARSIAYYRDSKLDASLELLDQLIIEHPQDPYFIELKGQILYENGKIAESLPFYEQASQLLPGSALLHRELATAQLGIERADLLAPAIHNLRLALIKERKSPSTWRQLAIAYGRNGEKGKSSLALAEEALLIDKPEVAKYHGGLAERLFPHGSREWLQAQDIQIAAKDLERRIKARNK